MSCRLRMWSSSMSPPGAHAIELELEPVADVALVLHLPDLDRRHEAELDELRVDREVERDEIRARFLERRAVVLERLGIVPTPGSIWPDAWPITSCMSVLSSDASAA